MSPIENYGPENDVHPVPVLLSVPQSLTLKVNTFIFFRDDVLPPPRSFEAIGSTPSSLWGEFTEDHEMGMCVSVDPQSGYRWNTRYCSGPDKAAFVCQIPGNSPFLCTLSLV